VVKLGEEARVSLPDFSLEGSNRRNLRRIWRKITDDGYTFEMVQPADVPHIVAELRVVSDEWIRQKQTREKSFSLGSFSEEYVLRYPVAVARKDGRIVAFSNAWISGQSEEIEADLMRYTADAPPGIMRFVLIEMMLWARGQASGGSILEWLHLADSVFIVAHQSGISLPLPFAATESDSTTFRGSGNSSSGSTPSGTRSSS